MKYNDAIWNIRNTKCVYVIRNMYMEYGIGIVYGIWNMKFSKVSGIVKSYSKFDRKLTFQNFHQVKFLQHSTTKRVGYIFLQRLFVLGVGGRWGGGAGVWGGVHFCLYVVGFR